MESQEQVVAKPGKIIKVGYWQIQNVGAHDVSVSVMKQSTPRIVNVRATAKGAACPEFVAWLYERIATPFAPGCPFASDWITTRFERVT